LQKKIAHDKAFYAKPFVKWFTEVQPAIKYKESLDTVLMTLTAIPAHQSVLLPWTLHGKI